MNKVFAGIITAAVFFSVSVNAFAAVSTVTVENNDTASKPITYTYNSEKQGETEKSIKPLMTELQNLYKKGKITQKITVKSESAGKRNVSMTLRLSLQDKADEALTQSEKDALAYYDIKVTDSNGQILYSEDNGDYKKGNRDIPLGILNKLSDTESQTYDITISVNKELDKASVKNDADKLDWSIVSDVYIPVDEVTPKPASIVTSAPTIVPSSAVVENKNGVITFSAGEYLCGKDIPAGRYVMSGSGKVRVYSPDGAVKSTVALKNKGENINGVEEYIVNLSEGEKLSAEADITLTPHTSKATASPKPTKTPSASKATATPKAGTSSKTNPKTGDAAPIAIVFALGIMSIAAVIFIEINKRNQY